MHTLQIECLLQRFHPKTNRPGTIVPFDQWPTPDGPFANKPPTPARVYEFKPVDGSDPTSPHVCREVLVEHAHRLLECNGAYRVYDDDLGVARPVVQAPPGASTDHALKTAPVVGDDPDAHAPRSIAAVPDAQHALALANAVQEIRDTGVKILKEKINTFDREALKAAYDIEDAIKGPERRRGFLQTVGAHLGLPTS